ncbi:DEKNAAC102196 [Brettanomyces naardenensis]|uniref:DEKNAAC102196 n=1 Tax=Brettanomyces naardenensis TaxID=13370 RepID=A0A448YJW4_BRENA|nr:DEKNAAC102196 [Brettanomyces naardenensis]
MQSTRSLKRQERRKRHQKRVDALKETYISSDRILQKVNRLENKSTKTASDYRSIESLKEKYELLHSYEQLAKKEELGKGDKTESSTETSNLKQRPALYESGKSSDRTESGMKILNLKQRSVFYDPELNPLGQQPYPDIPNFSIHKVTRPDSGDLPCNVTAKEAESIPLPSEPKPRFYSLKQTTRSYQSEDFR